MKRREFLGRAAFGLGAAWLGSKTLAAVAVEAPPQFSATDMVTLGRTGIQTTRLACGTGTIGYNHSSNQAKLGIQGLADLLWAGYDQGIASLSAPTPTAPIRTWQKPSSESRARR
jgi:hypothetical protein